MTEFTEKVIFDGAKTLWKSRINLEVLIVHHVSSHESVIEIITYNSNIGAESTRIYADYSLIANRIPTDVIDLHKSEKHDFFLKHHIVMGATELTATVIQEIIIEFITSRLSLRTDLAEGQFEIYLEHHFGDALQHSTGKLEVECDPPKHLHPYEVKRRPHTSYVAFNEEISKFSDDKKSIDKECSIALTYEHEAEHNLEIERKLRHKHYKNEHKLHVNRWKLAIKRVIDLQRNHYYETKYCPTQHKHAAKISKWLGSKLGETIRHNVNNNNSINKNNRTAVSQYAKNLDSANTTHLRPLDTEHHRRNSHGDKLERVHGSVGVLNPDPKHVNAMRSWSQDHGVVSAPLTSHSTPALHNSAEYKPKDFREWRDDDTQISDHGPVNTSSHSTSKSHHSYLTKPVAKNLPTAHTSLFDVTTTVLTDDHHLLPSTKLHSTAQHPAVHRQENNKSSHNSNHSTHNSGSNKAKEREAVPHHVPAINTTSNSNNNSNNNNATNGSTSGSGNTKEQPHSTVYDVLHTAHAEQQSHHSNNNSGNSNNRSPVRTPSPSLVNNFVSLSTNNSAHVPTGVHLKPIEDNIGHGTTLDAHGTATGRHSPHHEPIILQKLQHRPKELSSNNLLELGNSSDTKHASPSHSAHHGADDRHPHPHPHISHSSHISTSRDHSPDLNRTRLPSVHFDEPLLGESIPLTLDLHATSTTAHSTSTVRRKSNENMQHSATAGSVHLSPVKQHSGELGGSGDLRSALKKKTSENLGIAEAGIISSTSLDRRHSKDLRLETHHSPSTLPPLSPMTTAHHGPNSSNSSSPHTSLLRRLSPGKELNFDAYKTVPVGDPQDHRHALKCVDADDVLEDV